MTTNWPRFWSTPFKYMRWAAVEKPALFYSIVIGAVGPISLLIVPPLRQRMGIERRPLIIKTYPSMLIYTCI
jgi:hypothetical protein